MDATYGPDAANQFVRIFPAAPFPNATETTSAVVFAIIHGGYFKAKYGIENSGVDSLVPFLLERGFSAALIEYRRVGQPGGGFPGSNEDIILALNKLNEIMPAAKIVVLGHSAGGTLALWACSSGCSYRPPSNDGQFPQLPKLHFQVALCVAVAPVGDLEAGYHRRLSDEGDAIPNYMKCVPSDQTDCPYKLASPHRLLPMVTPLLIAVGTADADVPADLVTDFYNSVIACSSGHESESESGSGGGSGSGCGCGCGSGSGNGSGSHNSGSTTGFSTSVQSQPAAASTPPLPVQFVSIPDADHFQVMTTSHPAWLEIFTVSVDMLATV